MTFYTKQLAICSTLKPYLKPFNSSIPEGKIIIQCEPKVAIPRIPHKNFLHIKLPKSGSVNALDNYQLFTINVILG
jgi:hypothetical protein